ncbi:MAG: FtsH protease activity modulator HflK [Dehalococcoidia bacterium]
MFQQQRPQPEINFDQILAGIRGVGGRLFGRFGGAGMGGIFLAILGLLVAVWMATGFYQVKPAEMAALRQFGKYTGVLQEPGLHWFWPSPIGTRNIEAVTETRRLELGFRSLDGGQGVDVSAEALMITGDLNIADVQMIVQYRINDLAAFLFNVDDPGDFEREVRPGSPEGFTLKDATEAALRLVVGQRSIDDVLLEQREAVQVDTLRLLQDTMDAYETGIEILEVRLQTVRPPDAVRDAFDDVVRARVDKDARVNEARAYEQDKLPRARGDAQSIVQDAEAFKQERILKATGEADRFLSVLAEYKESKEVTRQRLYLEAMEEILPGITKFIVSPDTGGNLLQFLPLTEDE